MQTMIRRPTRAEARRSTSARPARAPAPRPRRPRGSDHGPRLYATCDKTLQPSHGTPRRSSPPTQPTAGRLPGANPGSADSFDEPAGPSALAAALDKLGIGGVADLLGLSRIGENQVRDRLHQHRRHHDQDEQDQKTN